MEALRRAQAMRLERLRAAGDAPLLRHYTRHRPRRADEILDNGSLYWVIKGSVRVRQRIAAIEDASGGRTGKRCAFVLDPGLVLTEWQPRRPHQGWRYLDPGHAPADAVGAAGAGDLPLALANELRVLGLI